MPQVSATGTIKTFDLTPDPRVLHILGEISLDQWKCLAELIDNSVDAFIGTKRRGAAIDAPEVQITLPTTDRDDAFVSVRDNGPGMTIEQLEAAVKAGWSGNNPLDALGLFGMGFNIATARLGIITEVYTTRAGDPEWTGLRIDLNELRRTRSYHTPQLSRPKPSAATHGTEIRILKLKADQRSYFAKSANHGKIRRQLSKIYAPLLLDASSTFTLQMNGQAITPKRPCYWGPQRSSQAPDGTIVHAVEPFDFKLAARRYCLTCMTTFGISENCPTAGAECSVVQIDRRLHGWIGIQRYMHEEDFGIDLIRNGRVIESLNKDLFVWTGEDRAEREYPIDDQRNRGRFIGEVHLDHCRVSYTKDRFERDDPSWTEMVALVRGEGPLQPQKARKLGFGPQDAPLYKIFQVFRRSSPQGKTGRWSRILVVKNNERAIEMADLFQKGDPDYQTDDQWWDLVEEEDRALVGGSTGGSSASGTTTPVPEGFLDEQEETETSPVSEDPIPTINEPEQVSAPSREKVYELSRIYKHPLLKIEFNVEAFLCESDDPALSSRTPWKLHLEDPATRTFSFLFSGDNPVFRSMTLTPLDCLLTELTLKTYEFLSDTNPSGTDFAAILCDFRLQYAKEMSLDPRDLIGDAIGRIRELASSLVHRQVDYAKLFSDLPKASQDQIRRKIASTGSTSFQEVVSAGEFLTYAQPETIADFVFAHPELYFDGAYWDQPYATLDFGSKELNEEMRGRVLQRYGGYLTDATWLASQSPRDLTRAERDEVIRATIALRLLRSDKDQ